MVEGIIKKIMIGGMVKYSKLLEIPIEKVQIKVTDNPNGTVFYDICNNLKVVERVSFLNIMDKKMDLFGYEAMSNPFMKKSLEKYAFENDAEMEDISSFIMKHNEIVVLSFFNKFKNITTVSLAKHLQSIGL